MSRERRTQTLRDVLSERTLALGGPDGSYVLPQDLSPADYGGAQYEGCPEPLTLNPPVHYGRTKAMVQMPVRTTPVANVTPLLGYFDESESHVGAKAFAVAGFVSPLPAWTAFELKWKKLLNEWNIDFFHMTDFENYKREYAQWTTEEHRWRLNQLLDLMSGHTTLSFGLAISGEDYEAALPARIKKLVSPHHLLSMLCFINVSMRLREETAKGLPPTPFNRFVPMDLRIGYVFEDRTNGKGAILDAYSRIARMPNLSRELRALSLSFEPKRKWGALQAADVLAYEICKGAVNMIEGNPRPARYPLTKLFDPGNEWFFHPVEELRRNIPLFEDLFQV